VRPAVTAVEVRPDPAPPRVDGSPGLTHWRNPQRLLAVGGLGVAISFLVAVTLNRELSNDVFWQLASGQWMLAHHAFINRDPFSYTESHRRWVTDEWGSEVALALMYKAFGAAAYNMFAIATGSLSLGCATLYARALGARGGRLAAIAILLAIGIANFVAEDRGLSFSLIWLPLELLILTKARTTPRWLWWLPLLCLVWVNTHGSILVGLLVIGVELAWSAAPPRWVTRIGGVGRAPSARWLGLAGLGCLVASCITPYGPGLLTYDLSVARNSQIARYITEWNSPDFHSVMVLLTFCIPLGVLIAAVRTKRVPLLEATLTVGFFVGALHAQRIVVYLMVAAVGLAAGLPARLDWSPRSHRMAGAGLIGLMVAILSFPSVPAGTIAPTVPVQAFSFLASHPGRIFTQYTWGDYSIARHRATFADGRTDLFAGTVLTEFFDVTDLTVNPDPVLSRYGVDYVVWAPGTPLAEYLAGDPRWRVVDRAGPALVFARRSVWAGRST
jgi:hypothetical protein